MAIFQLGKLKLREGKCNEVSQLQSLREHPHKTVLASGSVVPSSGVPRTTLTSCQLATSSQSL